MIKYSIIICTYNRYDYLIETLHALSRVVGTRGDCEIIVVDNNSKDETKTVKDTFSDFESIRYVLEASQGLSHARNRGITESNGSVLVFLDDDIDIVDDYFDVCDSIFDKGEVGIFGGKVLPYKVEIPNWLPNEYYYLVSVFDLGDETHVVKYVMGGNCAMNKVIAEKVGMFNTSLGRTGDNLMSGEENDYQDRARQHGFRIVYYPGLTILHKINNKLNKEYVLNYAYLNGRSSEIFIKKQWGLLKYNLKLLKAGMRYISYFIAGRKLDKINRNIKSEIQLFYDSGFLNLKK